ncbi:hypothetical protein BH10BAC2_BH10BAC2_47820 [soil metagenome]
MNLAANIAVRIKRLYKNGSHDVREITGFNKKLYSNARGARIVTYHGICIKDHLKFNTLFLRLDTFKAHLAFYKKHFHIISLDDYYAKLFREDKFNICICFDDGFYNNYKYVLPLLKEHEIPATFFITAIREAGYDILWNDFLSIIGKYGPGEITYKNEPFYKNKEGKYFRTEGSSLTDLLRLTDFEQKAEMIEQLNPATNFKQNKAEEDFWLQMTMEEIKNLSNDKLYSIGSHGYYHNDLANLSTKQLHDEMIRSKEYLERITGKKVRAIAFPYGSYTAAVIAAAKKAGYTQLLALNFNSQQNDETMKERIIVNPYISVANQMLAIINGKYA